MFNLNNFLPVMLLKELVILPNQEVRLELNNDLTDKILELSLKHHDGALLVVCPKDQIEESPEVTDLPQVGVIGKIKSKIKLPNGNLRVTLLGLNRVRIIEYKSLTDDQDVLMSSVETVTPTKYDIVEETASRRKLLETTTNYIKQSPNLSNSILNSIKNISDLGKLTDMITTFLPFPVDKKLSYMEEIDALKRANNLIYDLSVELEVLALDEKIDEALRIELENNQKDFILREKINQIKKELGDEDEHDIEIEEYKARIKALNLSDKTTKKLMSEVKKLDNMPDLTPEVSIAKNYLDQVLSLPWHEKSQDNTDLSSIQKSLDETHYGLKKVKDRIIEYVAIKKRNPNLKSPIICLIGPPGVGKTSIALGIAKALNKEFYKISVGGLDDAAELNGHRRTYLGSNPGKIIQALQKCNVNNPLILIDEIDKMVKDYKGDPASVLLDILDPEQNTMFIDNYIEEPFDLSNVMFILTANDLATIPEALIDRLEIIEMHSYTELEKIDIANRYLIPTIYKEHLLTSKDLKISDEILKYIINNYTKEAGVRELKRLIASIARKHITASIQEKTAHTLTKKDIIAYLGEPKYDEELNNNTLTPGLINGLAYTPYGGVVMPIEACFYEGKGKIITTGLLGEVMKESTSVAISYIRSHKDELKINDYYFDNRDLHLHALEGAIPKDGPSAGVTITTSLISLILNQTVPKNIAMTGEMSLRGDIIRIGGLKEKILGAYNENIKTIFIPFSNQPDLAEIPESIKSQINIIPVKNYNEIYTKLFKNN